MAVMSVLDIARYEAERRVLSAAALTTGLAVFGGIFIAIVPGLLAEAPLKQVVRSLPPTVSEMFGFRNLVSFEALLAAEYHGLGWIIGLGAYIAYTGAGSITEEIEDDRMDMLLAAPISRTSVLFEKFCSLLVPIVTINVVVPIVLYAGARVVGESLTAVDLIAVHALSIPYLLCCGAIGMFLAVVVRRGQTAKRASGGAIVGMWLLGAFVTGTDVEWIRALTPMQYFDPPAIVVDGAYDLLGAVILLAATVALLAVSRAIFAREDI